MPQYVQESFRALIVDDDPVSRKFLREFLDDVSDCDEVATGKEAVSAFAEALDGKFYELVCLDMFLPDIRGTQVLSELRAIEKKNGIPSDEGCVVIMTTSAADIKDVLQAMSSGCDGYVKKPYTKEQLFNELNRIGFELRWD